MADKFKGTKMITREDIEALGDEEFLKWWSEPVVNDLGFRHEKHLSVFLDLFEAFGDAKTFPKAKVVLNQYMLSAYKAGLEAGLKKKGK
jgi:hypothetical protein